MDDLPIIVRLLKIDKEGLHLVRVDKRTATNRKIVVKANKYQYKKLTKDQAERVKSYGRLETPQERPVKKSDNTKKEDTGMATKAKARKAPATKKAPAKRPAAKKPTARPAAQTTSGMIRDILKKGFKSKEEIIKALRLDRKKATDLIWVIKQGALRDKTWVEQGDKFRIRG